MRAVSTILLTILASLAAIEIWARRRARRVELEREAKRLAAQAAHDHEEIERRHEQLVRNVQTNIDQAEVDLVTRTGEPWPPK